MKDFFNNGASAYYYWNIALKEGGAMTPEVRHFITEVLRVPECFVFRLFATLWR